MYNGRIAHKREYPHSTEHEYTTEQPEDGADVCVRAYLNPHITCHLSTLHLSTLLHVTPYAATPNTSHIHTPR